MELQEIKTACLVHGQVSDDHKLWLLSCMLTSSWRCSIPKLNRNPKVFVLKVCKSTASSRSLMLFMLLLLLYGGWKQKRLVKPCTDCLCHCCCCFCFCCIGAESNRDWSNLALIDWILHWLKLVFWLVECRQLVWCVTQRRQGMR